MEGNEISLQLPVNICWSCLASSERARTVRASAVRSPDSSSLTSVGRDEGMYRTMNSFMGKMCVRGWAIKCGMIPDGLMRYGYWFDPLMLS